MSPYNIFRGTEATRRAATSAGNALEPSHGSTSDEHILYVGDLATKLGYPTTFPQVPLHGQDVRRMWQVASMGQADSWTNEAGTLLDGSGMLLSPKSAAACDPVARGYIQPYELADGGTILMESYGTYKCGSLSPKIAAKLKVGQRGGTPVDYYIYPDYGIDVPSTSVPGFDVASGVVSQSFDWSYPTLGTNALAGYEALSSLRTNTPAGQFSWRLTTKLRSLGRYAKHETYDEDLVDWATATGYTAGTSVVRNADLMDRAYICTTSHTSGASTKPGTGASWTSNWREITGNVAVEMTLEWGALHYNPGEVFNFNNPFSENSTQYSVFWNNAGGAVIPGVKRGVVYAFLGQQWLCHAPSLTNATSGAKGTWATTRNNVVDMLAEQAPGVGAYWKEFFVPLVSHKTFTAFGFIDHTVGNEITLELGGPTYVAPTTSISAYSATTDYNAEVSVASDGGNDYVCKATIDYNATAANANFPRMDAGAEVSVMTAAPTASVSGSISGHRFWRLLATNLGDRYDTMRLMSTQAYLYGGRVGAYQVRNR